MGWAQRWQGQIQLAGMKVPFLRGIALGGWLLHGNDDDDFD